MEFEWLRVGGTETSRSSAGIARYTMSAAAIGAAITATSWPVAAPPIGTMIAYVVPFREPDKGGQGMEPESYSFFKIDITDGIATAMFNRPEVGNRWALAEEHELFRLPVDVGADPDIKAVILTGAGDSFCGGAHHSDDPFDAFDYYDRSCRLFGGFMNIDKPVVVAVNGAIGGSGLTLAMFGDIVVAERHVTFGDPHVKVGVASATGPFQWPPSVGLMRAKRYLLTGDTFSAEEAERMGLISEVVDTGRSVERANEYARQLADLPPAAVQATKRALNQWLRMGFGPIFQHALSLEFMTFPVALLNYGAGADTPQH